MFNIVLDSPLCSSDDQLTHPSTSPSDVCTKYQEASKIVNLALQGVVGQCVAGANILDICEFGTAVINAQAAKLYTKKVNGNAIERGVAFPVSVAVNDVVCNYSPLATDETVCNCVASMLDGCVG